MSAVLAAELVTDAGAFAALEPEWWDLWRRVDATPFASPAWCLPWWQVFAPGGLRCLVLRRDGQLEALGPCWLEDGALGRRLLPVGIGITDYLDPLAPADADVARALSDAAATLVPDWQRWSLEELPPGSAGLWLPPPRGCRDEGVEAQHACPVLALPVSGDDPVPSARRRKLRMSANRLARREGVVREVSPADTTRFLRDLVRLHGARWTSRGEGGVLADDAVVRFHEAALPRLAHAGLVRLFEVVVVGAVVGSYYGLADGANAYAYLSGFDPDFAFESPGTVLVGHAIEHARQEGARAFHFLRGQEPYKYEWGATDRWNSRRNFRRSPA